MTTLLVVEDQSILLDSIRQGLEAEGFDVLTTLSGAECRRLCESQSPDAVVLDLMLPDGDGLSVLSLLRERGFQKPVMIVSARDTVDQRISGLNTGADDYLVKPFEFSELVARLRALLRRDSRSTETTQRIDDLVLDLASRNVTRGDQRIDLTPRQFDMLAYFIRHKHQVISRETLAREVWREPTATWTNVIEVQINRLRSKLDLPGNKPLLHTIRGKGYLFGDCSC